MFQENHSIYNSCIELRISFKFASFKGSLSIDDVHTNSSRDCFEKFDPNPKTCSL